MNAFIQQGSIKLIATLNIYILTTFIFLQKISISNSFIKESWKKQHMCF